MSLPTGSKFVVGSRTAALLWGWLAVLAAGACSSRYSVEGGTTVGESASLSLFQDVKVGADTGKAKDAGKPKDGATVGDSTAPGTDEDATPLDDTSGTSDDTASAGGDTSGTGSDACSLACQTDADCANMPGLPACRLGACEGGCCTVVLELDGPPCDDGLACSSDDACLNGSCTGTASGCDDGLACTLDTCDAKGCKHEPTLGFCFIEGACYADGETDPASDCQWCEVGTSQSQWAWKSTCCKKDADCAPTGPCDIPTCDVGTGKCLAGKKPGCCVADSECDDGDLCTIDACELATGQCKSVDKDCGPAGLPCQTVACNPASGQCESKAKPGFCTINGACIANGATAKGDICKVCASALKGDGWSPNQGETCNDNNDCTMLDACSPEGFCSGQPKPGCCKFDADCPAPANPCQIAGCNVALGKCVTTTKPGCCDAGVCCDLGANQPKPATSPCSQTVLATEYQCVGTKAQKRETSPGCDGSSATACTSTGGTVHVGSWATLKDCAPGSCVANGSGVEPTCKSALTGSCAGSCGGKSNNGTCYCDSYCTSAGDCCSDFSNTCACTTGVCCDTTQKVVKPKGTACGSTTYKTQWQCSGQSIQKRVGAQACSGGSNGCPTADDSLLWGAWQTTQTCASPAVCQVAAGGTSASCVTGSTTGSCKGSCGGQSANGTCWCDTACKTVGDCCSDFAAASCGTVQKCGATTQSCNGACGIKSKTGTCYCDNACTSIGDCCPDKKICGC